jgi:hypothetical protein
MPETDTSLPVEDVSGADESPAPEGGDQTSQKLDLPDELIAELRRLIKKFGTEEMPNHRQELLRAREGRFFWRGYQYPMYNSDQGAWAVPESGGFPWLSSSDDRSKRFYYVHNIYTPLGKTLISTLAGTPPPVRFNPCNPLQIEDIDSAKEAEKYRQLFYRAVNIGQVLRDVARYAYTDGRVIGWVRKETSGAKYGHNSDGTPKTQEIVDLYGVLETKVPISLRSQNEFPYLMVSTEKHLSELKAKYPDKADKIKDHTPSPGDDQFERTCRLAVLQGTEFATNSGESYNHLVTEQVIWLRPSAFEMILDKAKRDALIGRFSGGCRITYAGQTFVEAIEENMDDCLALFQPMSGDGQAVPSLGQFVISVQKRLNNLINMVQEKYEKGQPTKFVDSKAIDVDAMTDQIASPEVYMPIKRPPGEALANLFFKEPEPEASPDLIRMIADLKGPDAQMISGAQPSLFGGSMVNAKAAAIYSQARDQAIGSLALTYGPLKTFLARINELAAMSAEAREEAMASGLVPNASGIEQTLSVDLDKLRAGHYKCEPEVDESLPDSPSAQRQTFMQMVQFMPDVMGQLMQHPDNQYFLQQVSGLKGFVVPGADQRNVQLREIEMLLKTQAEPPSPEEVQKIAQHQTLLQMAGHPTPQPTPEDMLRPSIEIDPIFDDHNVHLQECKRWMYSDEGQQARMFNAKGYDNVRLHALEHFRALSGGPDANAPVQDNIPDPQQAIQGAKARTAVAAHGMEGQQPAPKLQNKASKEKAAQGGQ